LGRLAGSDARGWKQAVHVARWDEAFAMAKAPRRPLRTRRTNGDAHTIVGRCFFVFDRSRPSLHRRDQFDGGSSLPLLGYAANS